MLSAGSLSRRRFLDARGETEPSSRECDNLGRSSNTQALAQEYRANKMPHKIQVLLAGG